MVFFIEVVTDGSRQFLATENPRATDAVTGSVRALAAQPGLKSEPCCYRRYRAFILSVVIIRRSQHIVVLVSER